MRGAPSALELERRAVRRKERTERQRTRMYHLAETYNRWLVAWWDSGPPGARDKRAKDQLERARRRMDRAGRSLPTFRKKQKE